MSPTGSPHWFRLPLLITLAAWPLLSPAPPSAIQVGAGDFCGQLASEYGVSARPNASQGQVSNPAALARHGIRARKGDPVQIEALGSTDVINEQVVLRPAVDEVRKVHVDPRRDRSTRHFVLENSPHFRRVQAAERR